MESFDWILVLCALICIWIAFEASGGSGGGHRMRVPSRL
jgi:hypothetical protein